MIKKNISDIKDKTRYIRGSRILYSLSLPLWNYDLRQPISLCVTKYGFWCQYLHFLHFRPISSNYYDRRHLVLYVSGLTIKLEAMISKSKETSLLLFTTTFECFVEISCKVLEIFSGNSFSVSYYILVTMTLTLTGDLKMNKCL